MRSHAPTLLRQVVLLFELDGWEGVEKYAKENGIPVNVCRKLLDKYLLDAALPNGPRALNDVAESPEPK